MRPGPSPFEASLAPLRILHRRVDERHDAALDAHGGLEPLQAAGGVAVVAEGTFDLTVRLQGRSPDEPEPTPALVIGMGLAAEAFWGGFSIARLIPLLAAATP